MQKFILLTIFSLMLQSCSFSAKEGYYKGYELPAYKEIKKIDEVEFRQYESSLVAEVEVNGTRQEGAKKGFMILARYIFGKNISQEKVAMTSPVAQQEVSEKISMTSPVTQVLEGDKKWRVQFAMPKKYQIATLPKPNDEKIKFKILPAKKMLALRFSSLWNDKKINEEKEKLEIFIRHNDLKSKGVALIAYYDDPFTFPWNRRNEILWEIE